MPKKSTKSKSKRMTLRQKHKILRKVKEHHKKLRREDKKKGPKKVKDPGLPSQWPYKEELVKEFAFKRAQILADEKRRKEERKAAAQVGSSKCIFTQTWRLQGLYDCMYAHQPDSTPLA